MRYYLMERDERFTDVPYIKSWPERFDSRKIKVGQSKALPRRVLMEIYPNSHTVFSDIVLKPFLLLNEKARKVLGIYETKVAYKQVILLDSENELTSLYFLPILETVYCTSAKNEQGRVLSFAQDATLERTKLPRRSMFKVSDANITYTVVKLDLAESLLRRGVQGVMLKEIKII